MFTGERKTEYQREYMRKRRKEQRSNEVVGRSNLPIKQGLTTPETAGSNNSTGLTSGSNEIINAINKQVDQRVAAGFPDDRADRIERALRYQNG